MPSRTPTKTTRPAESPAKTKPDLAPVRAVVPQTVDLIADAVSEMLTTGTNDQSLENLLYAAIEHITRRTYERGIGIDDRALIRKRVEETISHDLQRWKQDIIAVWQHNRRQSPAAIEPKTISEMIRANAREALEDRLEKFLGCAMPEEIRFLLEVMIDHDNVTTASPVHQTSELPIGNAFEYQLYRSNAYLIVPARLSEKVDKYIADLMAIEDKTA